MLNNIIICGALLLSMVSFSAHAQLTELLNLLKNSIDSPNSKQSPEASAEGIELQSLIKTLNSPDGGLQNTEDVELQRIRKLIPKRLGPLGDQVQNAGGERRNLLAKEYMDLNRLDAEIGNELQRRFSLKQAEELNAERERAAAIKKASEEEEALKRRRLAEEDKRAKDPNKIVDEVANAAWQKFLDSVLKSIKDADVKGAEAAEKSKMKYRLSEVDDQITLKKETKAVVKGDLGSGKYELEIFCNKKMLMGSVTVYDSTFPDASGKVKGRMRVNGQVTNFNYTVDDNWSNVINITLGEVNNSGRLSDIDYFALDKSNNWIKISNKKSPMGEFNPSNFTCQKGCSIIYRKAYSTPIYDFAVSIPTSDGMLFVAIPPYDLNVRKVMLGCKGPEDQLKSGSMYWYGDFIEIVWLNK